MEETMESIRSTFRSTGYTMDPHTAVGKWVYNEYCREMGLHSNNSGIHRQPEFPGDVLQALKSESPVLSELPVPINFQAFRNTCR